MSVPYSPRVENAEGYMLTKDGMVWFWNHYLEVPEHGKEPNASPLLGNTHGLPPALIQTAEFDPLRDEGAALYLFNILALRSDQMGGGTWMRGDDKCF